MKKLLIYTLISLAVIFISSEIVVRSLGIVSFPLYIKTQGAEYYLAPNQHGAFLNRNRWWINDIGFGNDRPFSASHPSCMLVGDSIVYGGNPLDYFDRVGPIAQRDWGYPIWNASAGGWSLLNELAFLRIHDEQVRQVDHLVFVLNSGDFGAPAIWTGERAFPTTYPLLASIYTVRRYLLPQIHGLFFASEEELPPIVGVQDRIVGANWRVELEGFLSRHNISTTIIMYPSQREFEDWHLWMGETAQIRKFAKEHAARVKLVDFRSDPSWSLLMYRDSSHPNANGNRVLAAVVAKSCENNN